MRDLKSPCKLAVVQAAPVMFDKAACVDKAVKLIRNAAGRKDWKGYYDNSILVPGPETDRLAQAAKEAHAYVSIGVSGRDACSATLYNSNVIFSPEGELLTNHRKLKPTGSERVVWGDADRDYFPMADTPWGPMASMICWESYMPLARAAVW